MPNRSLVSRMDPQIGHSTVMLGADRRPVPLREIAEMVEAYGRPCPGGGWTTAGTKASPLWKDREAQAALDRRVAAICAETQRTLDRDARQKAQRGVSCPKFKAMVERIMQVEMKLIASRHSSKRRLLSDSLRAKFPDLAKQERIFLRCYLGSRADVPNASRPAGAPPQQAAARAAKKPAPILPGRRAPLP